MAQLVPIPFELLLRRIYHEYRGTQAIFDLPSRKFYRPAEDIDLSVTFCGNHAANPLGPAAGPQTQLAQNIVLSWLAGGRILELKTVQVNDRLRLSRPCIDMATVGFNSEWSQELTLDESLREYVKASIIIEILRHSLRGAGFSFQSPALPTVDLATVLDVSVGYDLAGIQSSSVRNWLRAMRNASGLIDDYRRQMPDEFAPYRELAYSTEIANSITLSTFHGTPADEIERICEFLLTEMDYHVIIKMNPPMLGKGRVNELLHERLGYTDIAVHEKVYDVNMTFPAAVDVVRRLQAVARRAGKTIGVKFGNTLEVVNTGTFLRETVQYLSGRPLHVLHLALVHEWRKHFGADVPISFSAGVDAVNFADMVSTGCVPITTCTDLLRPGGYGRMQTYLVNLERLVRERGAKTISEFIVNTARRDGLEPDISPENEARVLAWAMKHSTSMVFERSLSNPRYHSRQNRTPPRKIGSHLHLWDCINCDKCIPVCPNDANFSFDVEPVELYYKNIHIMDGTWHETEGGRFRVTESHQIATYADACNDCGNCDVFCPEDGGPYIEKPRFFGSVDSYRRAEPLNGFFLSRERGRTRLLGRFEMKEFELTVDPPGVSATFSTNDAVVVLDRKSHRVISAQPLEGSTGARIDLGYYFVMDTLMTGMMSQHRVHFVNAGLLDANA